MILNHHWILTVHFIEKFEKEMPFPESMITLAQKLASLANLKFDYFSSLQLTPFGWKFLLLWMTVIVTKHFEYIQVRTNP